MQSRLEMKQPNGSYVTIDLWDESMSAYTKEDFEKDTNLRGEVEASIFVSWPYGSFFSSYDLGVKKLYFDNKGLYTYKRQKKPFYYWKPQNIEEDYDNWSKNKNGYSIPLNEPRKLKKNIF